MKLIGFVGPRGSGKDTCAVIAKEAGIVAGKIPFAGPLKRICSEVFGIPLDTFEHPVWKEEPSTFILTEDVLAQIIACMDEYVPFAGIATFLKCAVEFHPHTDKVLSSPRHVLQYVGTEIIRAYQPDWHCRAAFSPLHLKQLDVDMGGTYAVTDCRFVNEHEFLSREHDAHFHYIHRPEAEAVLAYATHPSELEIFQVRKLIPSTILNTGTLDELAAEVVGGYA